MANPVSDFFMRYLHWFEIAGIVVFGIVCAVAAYTFEHREVLIEQGKTELVQGKLDTANVALAQRDSILADCNASTIAAQKEETAAKNREAQARQELADFKAANQKKATDFVKNTEVIMQKPECSVLKERLCPAAMGY